MGNKESTKQNGTMNLNFKRVYGSNNVKKKDRRIDSAEAAPAVARGCHRSAAVAGQVCPPRVRP